MVLIISSAFVVCFLVDCVMSPWSVWTECSATCGGAGMSHRTRAVERQPACDGKVCSLETRQSKSCNRMCLNGGELSQRSCSCAKGWSGQCCETGKMFNNALFCLSNRWFATYLIALFAV